MSIVKLWWTSLAIFTAVIGVVAWLLMRIIAAAQSIDEHAQAIWTVGKQIAGNTVSIWMLGQTNEQLARIADSARSIERTAGSIDATLRSVGGAAGSAGPGATGGSMTGGLGR
ncbi:MAG: hypothetical protein HY329_11325 [Chloroflexi bacterium]|nr:hypothetical protein [Chloroflexota bacterium]